MPDQRDGIERYVRYGVGVLFALPCLYFLLLTWAVYTGHTVRVSDEPLVDSITPFGLALIFGSAATRLFKPAYSGLVLLSCAGAALLVTSAAIKPHPLLIKGAVVMCLGVMTDVAQTVVRARKRKSVGRTT